MNKRESWDSIKSEGPIAEDINSLLEELQNSSKTKGAYSELTLVDKRLVKSVIERILKGDRSEAERILNTRLGMKETGINKDLSEIIIGNAEEHKKEYGEDIEKKLNPVKEQVVKIDKPHKKEKIKNNKPTVEILEKTLPDQDYFDHEFSEEEVRTSKKKLKPRKEELAVVPEENGTVNTGNDESYTLPVNEQNTTTSFTGIPTSGTIVTSVLNTNSNGNGIIKRQQMPEKTNGKTEEENIDNQAISAEGSEFSGFIKNKTAEWRERLAGGNKEDILHFRLDPYNQLKIFTRNKIRKLEEGKKLKDLIVNKKAADINEISEINKKIKEREKDLEKIEEIIKRKIPVPNDKYFDKEEIRLDQELDKKLESVHADSIVTINLAGKNSSFTIIKVEDGKVFYRNIGSGGGGNTKLEDLKKVLRDPKSKILDVRKGEKKIEPIVLPIDEKNTETPLEKPSVKEEKTPDKEKIEELDQKLKNILEKRARILEAKEIVEGQIARTKEELYATMVPKPENTKRLPGYKINKLLTYKPTGEAGNISEKTEELLQEVVEEKSKEEELKEQWEKFQNGVINDRNLSYGEKIKKLHTEYDRIHAEEKISDTTNHNLIPKKDFIEDIPFQEIKEGLQKVYPEFIPKPEDTTRLIGYKPIEEKAEDIKVNPPYVEGPSDQVIETRPLIVPEQNLVTNEKNEKPKEEKTPSGVEHYVKEYKEPKPEKEFNGEEMRAEIQGFFDRNPFKLNHHVEDVRLKFLDDENGFEIHGKINHRNMTLVLHGYAGTGNNLGVEITKTNLKNMLGMKSRGETWRDVLKIANEFGKEFKKYLKDSYEKKGREFENVYFENRKLIIRFEDKK